MGQQSMNITINRNDLKDFTCECGNIYFNDVFIYKIVSALYSPTKKPTLLKLPCVVCSSCGKILLADEMLKKVMAL